MHPFRQWRLLAEIKLRDAANALDIHHTNLCKIEKGKLKPGKELADKMQAMMEGK